jgi:nucleotide-binding universal stress UspA family protein
LGSHVTLLSVESADEIDPYFVAELDKVEPGLGGLALEDFHHRTEVYLQRKARQLRATIGQEIQIAPLRGAAAPGIIDYIESHDIDLVVMTTHGRTGLNRWLYGSVTEKVLRGAECALLIIRSQLPESE